MFLSTVKITLILLPLGVFSSIVRQPVVFGRQVPSVVNGTASSIPTSTTFKTTSTSSHLNTITSSPPWDGIGTIPPPFCPSATSPGWCKVSIGTVQLNYWPTGAATMNQTFPKSKYLPEYDFTISPPWIYYIVNTMIATDWCGNLVGTTLKNFITSYSIEQITTLQPFPSYGARQRIGPPAQLQLSDLKTDCPQYRVDNESYEEIGKNNEVVGNYDPGCEPILQWPRELQKGAKGLWEHCGRNDQGSYGIFDPPNPVSPCPFNDPECLYMGAVGPTSPPILSNTALPDQAPPTTASTTAIPAATYVSPAGAGPTNTGAAAVSQPTFSALSSSEYIPSPNAPQGTSSPNAPPVPIATLPGSNIISASAGASSVVIGGQTVSAGGQGITVSGQVYSLASAGLVVGNSGQGSLSTYAIPAAIPSAANAGPAVATYEGQKITGYLTGPSAAVIGGQTLSIGGSVITLSGNQVASLGLSGLVIQAPGGGITTISIPGASSLSPWPAVSTPSTASSSPVPSHSPTSSPPSSSSHSPASSTSPAPSSPSVPPPSVTNSVTLNGNVASISSTSISKAPATKSLGALIMAGVSGGHRPSGLSSVVFGWIATCMAGFSYFI